MGAKDPRDSALIEGRFPVRAEIAGGLPGEAATIAALVRGARVVRRLAPGLATPGDLPAAPEVVKR